MCIVSIRACVLEGYAKILGTHILLAWCCKGHTQISAERNKITLVCYVPHTAILLCATLMLSTIHVYTIFRAFGVTRQGGMGSGMQGCKFAESRKVPLDYVGGQRRHSETPPTTPTKVGKN